MTQIEETQLPGVGVRHDFITKTGPRVGVIIHRSGHRELLIYAEDDPDRCEQSLRLDEDESHALAEILGQSQVTEAVTQLRQSVAGLTIDWIPVRSGSVAAGATIGRTELRRRTGATIVAIARGEQTIASPGADEKMRVGDVAVVVGTASSIERALNLLNAS